MTSFERCFSQTDPDSTGAEPFLYSLLARLEWDLAMSTSSLQCLRLDPVLRKSVADVLVPTSKIKVCEHIRVSL